MSETWQVVDEAGEAHEVAVDGGRGPARSWWAATPDVARRSHASARDAVVLVAQACGWGIAEVVAPGAETRAEARGYLEARRGALLAEIDRLTAARYVGGGSAEDWRSLAVENADGWSKATNELLAAREAIAAARAEAAREMREAAANVCDARAIDEGSNALQYAARAIRALPLPGGAQ